MAERFWHLFSGQVMLTENRLLFYLRFTEYERPRRSESHSNSDFGYPGFGSDQKKLINTSNWNLLLKFRFQHGRNTVS